MMNSTACSRPLLILRKVPYRHGRTIASHPLPSAPGPSISSSQPLSSKACLPRTLPAAADLHAPKKRRYSLQATSPFQPDNKQWVEGEHRPGAGTKPARRRGDMHSVGRGAQREDKDGQEEGGGIIVTSSKHSLRDKTGRPWSQVNASDGQDAGVGAFGVGIGIPSAPRKKRKPRVELRDLAVKPKREQWQTQKGALEKKFGDEGWSPRKKISPDAMDGIRALHEEDPEKWATPVLAEHFKVSPESIRRILKSKWKPKDDEGVQKRRERWARRHDRIWDHQAELGLRPKREKDRQVEDPDTFDEDLRAKEMLNMARRA